MAEVLFISGKSINGRILQSNAGTDINVQTIQYGQEVSVDNIDLIIVDLEDDESLFFADVTRFRAKCGFRDIPILVAVTKSQLTTGKEALKKGANGVLLKPFDSSNIAKQLADALRPIGGKNAKINKELVSPFLKGTIEVLKKMAKTKVVSKNLFLKKSFNLFGDISGVMGLTGNIEGNVAVTFQQDLAFDLIAKMVGCDETELSVEDIQDGIGELINMISGSAKKTLSGTDKSFNISIPTIVMGPGHQIGHMRNQPVIVMVFGVEDREIAVQLCVATKNNKQAKAKKTEKMEAVAG